MSPPCIVDFCENIGTHLLPSDETRRAQWIQAIQHLKPALTVRKHSRICSAHFKATDFIRSPLPPSQLGTTRRILNKTAVPSVFPWGIIPREIPSTSFNLAEVKKTYSRTPRFRFVEEQLYFNPPTKDIHEDPLKLNDEESSDLDMVLHKNSQALSFP